jgi:hypothetical protein
MKLGLSFRCSWEGVGADDADAYTKSSSTTSATIYRVSAIRLSQVRAKKNERLVLEHAHALLSPVLGILSPTLERGGVTPRFSPELLRITQLHLRCSSSTFRRYTNNKMRECNVDPRYEHTT